MNSDLLPKNKKILYAVLNWGLGHASRSILIIENLIQRNNEVVIASDGEALNYLQRHFPDHQFITLPSYGINYPYKSIIFNILLQSGKILSAIINEKKSVNKILASSQFDTIISDNRLGCYHKRIENIMITHQLYPHHQSGFVRYFFKKIISIFLSKFDKIWIPDLENSLLSGALSRSENNGHKTAYLGLVSAIKPSEAKDHGSITFLLSGPEPQRSKLESILSGACQYIKGEEIIFIRGCNTGKLNFSSRNDIVVLDTVSIHQVSNILNQSKLVICRSGYSTILDLYASGVEAILIPTPGQTEQEYLAHYHQKRWPFIPQDRLSSDLIDQIKASLNKSI